MRITGRQLIVDTHQLSGDPQTGDAPVILAGRRMYSLGYGSTTIGPIGDEHLVGRMGGIWAHPARVADGLVVVLAGSDGTELQPESARLTEQLNAVQWDWQAGDLHVMRRDWVLSAAPVYVLHTEVANTGTAPVAGHVIVRAPLSFMGCWFGGISCGEATYRRDGALVLGQDGIRKQWGIALGAAEEPAAVTITPAEDHTLVELTYRFDLKPGEQYTCRILLAVGLQGGAGEALERWRMYAAAEDTAPAAILPLNRPVVRSENSDLTRDIALAQANLELLRADYPDLGAYFLAGLPEYPQLFGCDTAYSIPGAVAAGFADTAGSALDILARYAERACGRIPHEITTNGRIFNPGNIQETPQFTIAVWDYLRWTGDTARAQRLFPLCREGMMELIPAHAGVPSGIYPYGDGMVERMGMGSRKLDSACYTIAGLQALAALAEALGEPHADLYRMRAVEANAAFERDWWIEEEGLYADSMHSDGSLQLDGHWTVVLPVQLGLAAPERAVRVMQRIERDFVNQWGLVHTRKVDERVWTLPTGLLALAAFRMGQAEHGFAFTKAIARTSEYGSLGYFKELIPQGLCFVQLWSAAIYIQAIVEGLLGITPDALAHSLLLRPCMPQGFPTVAIEQLRIGTHRLNLTISPQTLSLEHLDGPQALAVTHNGTTQFVVPGGTLESQ